MNQALIIQVAAYPGWIVEVSLAPLEGYQCWIVNPNLMVLNNGETYQTSSAAMAAGRTFVERHR